MTARPGDLRLASKMSPSSPQARKAPFWLLIGTHLLHGLLTADDDLSCALVSHEHGGLHSIFFATQAHMLWSLEGEEAQC